MLSRHYSPRTPVVLHERFDTASPQRAPDSAFVFFKKPNQQSMRTPKTENRFWLSQRGDPREAARTLFAILRSLDRSNWKKIHIERAPGKSALALAINDRLSRASAR
jgi:L-threonylcarbamoyladenylate synthase